MSMTQNQTNTNTQQPDSKSNAATSKTKALVDAGKDKTKKELAKKNNKNPETDTKEAAVDVNNTNKTQPNDSKIEDKNTANTNPLDKTPVANLPNPGFVGLIRDSGIFIVGTITGAAKLIPNTIATSYNLLASTANLINNKTKDILTICKEKSDNIINTIWGISPRTIAHTIVMNFPYKDLYKLPSNKTFGVQQAKDILDTYGVWHVYNAHQKLESVSADMEQLFKAAELNQDIDVKYFLAELNKNIATLKEKANNLTEVGVPTLLSLYNTYINDVFANAINHSALKQVIDYDGFDHKKFIQMCLNEDGAKSVVSHITNVEQNFQNALKEGKTIIETDKKNLEESLTPDNLTVWLRSIKDIRPGATIPLPSSILDTHILPAQIFKFSILAHMITRYISSCEKNNITTADASKIKKIIPIIVKSVLKNLQPENSEEHKAYVLNYNTYLETLKKESENNKAKK